MFYAEDVETIISRYDKHISDMHNAKQQLQEELKRKKFTVPHSPKFIVYEGDDVAEEMFWDILRSREKEALWFWPAKQMLKTVPDDVFQHFHEERIRRDIYLRVIWPEKERVSLSRYPVLGSSDTNEALREIRILPDAMAQITGYGIYGTRVGFLSSTQENFGFVIDSKELSQTLKSQFNYLWKLSKKYEE